MAITPDDIRRWLRDYPDKNVLLDDVEFDTDDIILGIKLTVADFNEETPFTSYSPDTFPFVACLANGVVAHLYEGEAMRQTRNNLQYATGNVQINDQSKGPEYSQLAAMFRGKYEAAKRKIKNFLNLEQGWGSVMSEYAVWRYY